MPEPVYVPFRGREVRVRHDDERLKPYMPMATVLLAACSLAQSVEGLRLVLASTVGEQYRLTEDGVRVEHMLAMVEGEDAAKVLPTAGYLIA